MRRPEVTVDYAQWSAIQQEAVASVFEAADSGCTSAVGYGVTGFGKTRVAELLIRECEQRRWPWVFYTHRQQLFSQTHKRFMSAGIRHGCRASGFREYEFLDRPGQLAMIPSEMAAVKNSSKREYHDARLVIWDEAHANKRGFAEELFRHHESRGAFQLGLTATPVGVGHLYQRLLVFGAPSTMRRVGAVVGADIYAPDEVELKNIGRSSVSGEFNQKELGKRFAIHKVAGRIIDHWFKYNPEARPTLLFAPGVKESMWFVDQFIEAGVTAAHIDGENVYCGQRDADGEPVIYGSKQKMRTWVEEQHKAGKISVVTNRFVFLMGVDWPWIEHVVFATAFGTVEMWIQAVGRGLRSYPENGKTKCIIQDHGGCLDDKTEVLTKRGWVGCGDIADSDIVAAFDRTSGEISWQPIQSHHVRTIDGGEMMYSAVGRCCDIRVTGNHRILFKKRTTAEGRVAWPSEFSLERADKLATSESRFKIPVSGWQKAAGVPLTDDQLSFIGWFVTDGTKHKHNLSITQADHQPQIADLRRCLVGCGFDFIERKRRPTYFSGSREQTLFSIPKGTCGGSKKRNGWAPLAGYLDKDLSPLLEDMTERQFQVFLHAVHLGDGSKDKGVSGSYSISTGNRVFADRLQSLCVRRGFRCSISERRDQKLLVLNIQKKSEMAIHGVNGVGGQCRLVKSAHSDPTVVWCVANPLGTLVTRRNGKVAIVGNSWHRHPSPNADIPWELTSTNQSIASEQKKNREEGKEEEPKLCPQCHKPMKHELWLINKACVHCGYQFHHSVRAVFQSNGQLKNVRGRITKVKPKTSEIQRAWDQLYFPTLNSKNMHSNNFNQLLGRFKKANPHCSVGPNAQGYTTVWNESGEPTVLKNVPKWGALEWEKRPSQVSRRELQWLSPQSEGK